MVRTSLLFIFLILSASSLLAKSFVPATLTHSDGTEEKLEIAFPFNQGKKLEVRKANEKSVKILSETVKSIEVTAPWGMNFTFVRAKSRMYTKDFNTTREVPGEGFLYVAKSCDGLTYYLSGSSYVLKEKKEELEIVAAAPGVLHHLQRDSEEQPTVLCATAQSGGIMIGQAKFFMNSQAAYFDDRPDIAERVRAKEFKNGDLIPAFDSYCQ